MGQRRIIVPPGFKFNNWTVLGEGETSYTAKRCLECICDCGNIANVRLDLLQRQVRKGYHHCKECKSIFSKIYSANPSLPRLLHRSYIYTAWMDTVNKNGGTRVEEWDDFGTFLSWFLSASGTQLGDHLAGRIGFSYYKIQRLDTSKPWGPTNAVAVKFVTERAFHERTYRYWSLLKNRKLLTPSLADSYIEFVNTFGNRERGYVLRRKSTSELHSRHNSVWVRRAKSRHPDGEDGEDS